MEEKRNVPKLRFPGFDGEWEQRKLGDVIDKLTGGASVAPDDYVDEGVRTIPKGAVNDTGIADLSGCKIVSEEFFKKNISSKTSTGELVTSLRDLVPTAPNMGRIVRIMGDLEDFLMPQGVYSIILKKNNNEDFLIAYSNSPAYRRIIATEKNGSTQVHIRNGEFLNIDIPVPSHDEQKKIGESIKNLDNLINLHQRKLEGIKEYKKGMLQKMFPKEGDKVPEIRFPGFSDDWEQHKVSDVSDRYDNLRIPVAANLRVKGSTPYYGANGIQDYVEGYTHDGEFILVAEDGANDLKNYPVNYVTGRVWVNNHAHVLQAKENIADNRFLGYAISRSDIESVLVGGGRAKLNAEVLMDISLQMPSLKEQIQISSFVSSIENLITLHQRKIDELKELKKGLLQQMFI